MKYVICRKRLNTPLGRKGKTIKSDSGFRKKDKCRCLFVRYYRLFQRIKPGNKRPVPIFGKRAAGKNDKIRLVRIVVIGRKLRCLFVRYYRLFQRIKTKNKKRYGIRETDFCAVLFRPRQDTGGTTPAGKIHCQRFLYFAGVVPTIFLKIFEK